MSFFDNWTPGRGGSLKCGDSNIHLLVRPSQDGWIMIQTDSTGAIHPHTDFDWIADELQMLESMASFVIDYEARKAELAERPDVRKETALEDGWKIVARREEGTFFRVTLHDDAGREVGEYAGFVNNARPTFVLGEMTIQGSHRLAEAARGKGLADRMRDAAEEVMELKAVPHGNFTQGSLSPAAARSWDRRADVKPVPGISPDIGVKVRRELMNTVQNRFKEHRYANCLATTLDISAATGCDVVVGYVDGKPSFARALSADGTPVSPMGILDADLLAETCKHRWGATCSGDDPACVTFSRMDAETARSLIPDDELELRRNDMSASFAARMVEKMANGTLPKLHGHPAGTASAARRCTSGV